MHDGGDTVSGRYGTIGEEHITDSCEVETGRGGTITRSDDHRLTSGGDGLAVIVEEGDLHFAIAGDKEFGPRIDAVEHASAVGAGTFFRGVIFTAVREDGHGSEAEEQTGEECKSDGF